MAVSARTAGSPVGSGAATCSAAGPVVAAPGADSAAGRFENQYRPAIRTIPTTSANTMVATTLAPRCRDTEVRCFMLFPCIVRNPPPPRLVADHDPRTDCRPTLRSTVRQFVPAAKQHAAPPVGSGPATVAAACDRSHDGSWQRSSKSMIYIDFFLKRRPETTPPPVAGLQMQTISTAGAGCAGETQPNPADALSTERARSPLTCAARRGTRTTTPSAAAHRTRPARTSRRSGSGPTAPASSDLRRHRSRCAR